MTVIKKKTAAQSTIRTSSKRIHSLSEFEALRKQPENVNRLLELINGEIIEKMPTQEHGLIASNINRELGNYAIRQKNGRPDVEVRHQAAGDDRNSRLPDVSFTRANAPLVDQGSVTDMPDLAVEIKSPDKTIIGMRATADYYLQNGSRLVWLVYPNYQLVEIYRKNVDVDFRRKHQILSGYDVLPGFELLVADVFADPFAA